jgi:uncharacterized pyridoxal phosphate-containing UPF0001 family protein
LVTASDFISEAEASENGREEGFEAELENMAEEEEQITALPPMPAHLLGQTQTKKQKKLMKKARGMMV